MEKGLGSDSNDPSGSIDKSRVLDVRPLRCLAPVFPNSPGMSSIANPEPTSFVCVPPSGPFPSGVQPFYPFLVSNDYQYTASGAQNQPGNFGFGSSIPAPVPLNSFRTPPPHENGGTGWSKRVSRTRGSGSVVIEDDECNDLQNQSDQYVSGFNLHVADVEDGSNTGKRRGRPRKRKAGNGEEIVLSH